MSLSVLGTSASTQAIFASNQQAYSPWDIEYFKRSFGQTTQAVPIDIGGYLDNNVCKSDPNACAESSLDLEYIMSTSEVSPTTFWYTENDFGTWLSDVANTASPPLVMSISYGSEEQYNSVSILDAFSTQAIKLSSMGVTIVVASGDDGANSRNVRYNGIGSCGYVAIFPASNPYVTSVGSTVVSSNYFA
jgi:tripeptidyl-peptidase-1